MRRFLVFFVAMGFLVCNAYGQNLRVTGTVTSQEDGLTLPGVTVVVKGTTIGATTDMDGGYTLDVPPGSVLQFSFIGMETKEILIEEAGTYNVELSADRVLLEETVVTALGITRERKSLGYSTQDVSSVELMQSQEANLANRLTGLVSGLQVHRSSSGPAGSSHLVLRGHTSLTGDNQPLIVVDGMPITNFTGSPDPGYWNPQPDMGSGIADISAEDIESISVLKGASAAALYGSRAGNGVILITTKSGVARPGLGITYSTQFGVESMFTAPDMQNTFGQGTDGSFDNLSTMSWGPEIQGQSVERHDGQQMSLQAYDNVSNFFDQGTSQNHNLSFQQVIGGTSVYASMTHRDDQSMIPNTNLTRTSFLSRAVTNFGDDDRWSLDAKLQYVRAEANNRPIVGHNYTNPFFTMYQLPISMDIRQFEEATDNAGNMRWFGGSSQLNPYWAVDYRPNNDVRDRFILHGTVGYQFTDWLEGEITAGSDIYTTNRENRTYAGSPESVGGMFSLSKETYFENNFSGLLSARRDDLIDRLGVSGNFGGNVMMQELSSLGANAGQLEVPNLFALNNSTENPSVSDNFWQVRILSLYGSVQFNWDDYLFLEGTMRNDWASTLSEENRSFLYPSVSLSYVFSEMLDIMGASLPNWFTFGRLRASFAQVGNALGPYELYNFYSIGNDPHGVTTANIGNVLFNPNVRSELITSQEFGADLRFFENRLSLDVTYYKTNATRQLINIPVDPLSGYRFRKVNAGDIQNEGVELVLTGDILHNPDGFSWRTRFNYSTNRNTVEELTEDVDIYRIGGFDNLMIIAEAGGMYGEIYGTTFRRVDDETSPHYGKKLLDGNGYPMMDPERTRLGSQQPDALMGIQNTLSYRNLSLIFQFDGSFGGKMFSQTNQSMQQMGTAAVTAPGGKREDIVVDGVIANGDGSFSANTIPITQQQYWLSVAGPGNIGIIEANIFDATNVRLRYVNLNYRLPRRVFGNMPIQGATVGMSVNNVWLITSHLNGVDPESVYATGTNALGFEASPPPTTRTFLFNLSVSF